MFLEPNTIFDNRYRLVQMLGQGASAQVWLAEDTLTNNLRVAIKIFNAQDGFDSYGQQDFQNEFTTVYNINHQNLLTPTNYSVNDGVPYLVLPYCENGSVSSMIGRCEESDIVKLLHDVAAGLEHLHKHNVIHQDIKPDNIMLDDDLNYLVSDFGISTGRNATGDTFGGTRAYMAPERFSGVSDAKGDVWALGATAYEMISGNAPFGDHGGLVQAQGEPVPPIDNPDLTPDFVKLIDAMLSSDPANRPTTDQIRRTTERVLETGSWKEKRGNSRTLKIGGIVIALVAIAAGFFVWGMFRTKTYYYSDYVEVNGAPVGIGSLYGSEQRARNASYRIQTKGGKVTRVSLVNGHGKIIDYIDSENLGVRFPDQEYHYGSNGRVEYMIARDSHGKVLYKFSYSDKGNTVSFQYDDEKNTPKFYSGTFGRSAASSSDPIASNTTSNIAHMFLDYDSDGRLAERQYLSLLKEPTPDANGAYGERYRYDSEGRVTEVMAIDIDGNPVSDNNGTAIRRYKYDENGNRTEVSFFTPDGSPAQEGHNIHLARLDYDDYGNLIKERYYNGNEDPVGSSRTGAFGYVYTYDENGFRTTATVIDAEGEPMFSSEGFVTTSYTDDGNGFNALMTLLDDEGNPTFGLYDGELISSVRSTFGPTGLALEITTLDDAGEPLENANGTAIIRNQYDDQGNLLVCDYLDANGNPAGLGANNSHVTSSYDNLGRMIEIANFDADGNPTENAEGVSKIRVSYSPYGSIEGVSYYNSDDKLGNDRHGVARRTFEYDNQGRMTTDSYYGADGNLTMPDDYARKVYGYDLKSSRLNQTMVYDASGKPLYTMYTTIDPNTGKLATMYKKGPNGQLMPGTAKMHYTYNDMGYQTLIKATDLNDRPVSVSLFETSNPADAVTGSEVRMVYDDFGNQIEVSFWGPGGVPVAAADGTHRRVNKFDSRGRRIQLNNYNTSGAPITVSMSVPETHAVYDNRGNEIELSCFDGHGAAINCAAGFHKDLRTFDSRGNIESQSFYDKAGAPINTSSAMNCARVTATYNERNAPVEQRYYTADGKLAHVIKYDYNDKGVNIRQQIFDGRGNLDDSLAGFSTIDIKVSDDGYTPLTARALNKSKQAIGSFTWDKKTGTWVTGNAVADTDQYQSSPSTQGQSTGGTPEWMAQVKKQAASCPREIMDGMVMRSIVATNTSVTITIVLKNISGNNYNRSEVAEIGNDYADFPHNYLGVPGSVACHVKVLNRENKVIYSK
ncbi:MAG: protein kinase [Odoribacter sp.]|nr:protein kinase [Odoribacter sp.]